MHGKISWQVQRRPMLGSRARPSSAITRLPWVTSQGRTRPERLTKGLARHPVPILLLARLAVDDRWQGEGAGKALLKDAMLRTLQAADIAGIRAFAVHAKADEARPFYLKFDFIPSPSDPMHLFVLLKDVRRIVSGPE
jgi:GNAT superfamily N-acetyltransferase